MISYLIWHLIDIYLWIGFFLGLYAIRPGFTQRTSKWRGTDQKYKMSRWFWFLVMLFGWGYWIKKQK